VKAINTIIERKEMSLAFNRIIEKSTKVSSIARGSEIFTKILKKKNIKVCQKTLKTWKNYTNQKTQ